MVRRLALIGVTTVALGAACSLTTSFAGLSGGAAADGGDASETSDADGERPSAEPDAGGEDASIDGPFCALVSDASFCDDFERQNAAFGWDLDGVTPDASLSITRAAGDRSSVLHAVVPAGLVIPSQPTGAGTVCLGKYLDHARRARVSFDVLLETVGVSTVAALVQVYSESDAGTTTEQIMIGAGANTLEEGVYPARMTYPHPLKRNLRVGAWERVLLDLAMDTVPPTISVSFGTDVVLPPTAARATPGTIGIYLPLLAIPTPAEAWSIYVDNLVVELDP